MKLKTLAAFLLLFVAAPFHLAAQSPNSVSRFKDQTRASKDESELVYWLKNMRQHRYSAAEMQAVTGLSSEQVNAKLAQYAISSDYRFPRDEKLLVLPYPGGRHPRIGFLEGAIGPQRETKLSVFCPWDVESYVVMDVPEAIWSNLGLTYLAHTHIDTVWTKQGIELEKLEWTRKDGHFALVRKLPNGIEFGVTAVPRSDHVEMKMWLTNGTDQTLSDLRVQNCVMLKGARGFTQQDNRNKIFRDGYAVCHSADKSRWIISSWTPNHRSWGNKDCPCLHSDPKFPICAPGETKWLRGWFSFYEGTDIDQELARIDGTGWKTNSVPQVEGNLVGQVIDKSTGRAVPCRLYVQDIKSGEHFFATSDAVEAEAVTYNKQMGQTASIERHASLLAGQFQLQLPPGQYRITAERGKEYRPATQVVQLAEDRSTVTLELQRFADMAAKGWYSGDTHVHRELRELPTAMLAEDLNVALPLSYWVRDSRETPADSNKAALLAQPNYIDAQHVIFPVNTEYEIFSINGKRHTQGAVFILNHQTPLELPAPPVGKIAKEARRQGAILDLDKHSWNWSLMVVPQMKVDLFELSNNHHWRTQFGFTRWTLENAPPDWQEIERNEQGFTERGWTEFGLQTYYRLLNCGFRMRVSAGTASGVHPVPLGYGRVYVHINGDFTYEKWIENLNRGNSFVTQGPLLDLRFNGRLPGSTWSSEKSVNEVNVSGSIDSVEALTAIELIQNGQVVRAIDLQPEKTAAGGYRYRLAESIQMTGTSWLALRCFQEKPKDAPEGKVIFAHTNPIYVDVPSEPFIPRRTDVEYFLSRMNSEICRNEGVLSEAAMAEFREAKAVYERLLQKSDN